MEEFGLVLPVHLLHDSPLFIAQCVGEALKRHPLPVNGDKKMSSTLKYSENAIYVVYKFPDGRILVKDAKTSLIVPIEELRNIIKKR